MTITLVVVVCLVLVVIGLGIAIAVLAGNPVEKANRLAKSGETIQATSILQEHLEKEPGDYRARFLLGKLQWRQSLFGEAATSFERAAEANAASEEASMLAALSYAAQNRPDTRSKEIENLTKVTQRAPNNTDAWYLLGLALGANGDSAGQAAALENVLSADRDNVSARRMLAMAHGLESNFDAATQEIRLATSAGPDDGDLAAARGMVAALQNDTAGAVSSLEGALEQGTAAEKEVNIQLGLLLMSQGDFRGAANRLRRATSGSNPDISAQYHLALCLQALRANDEAMQIFTELSRREGDYAAESSIQIAAYYAAVDPDRALNALTDADQTGADGAEVNAVRGRIFMQLGNDDEAYRALQDAVRSDPAYAPARLEFGIYYVRQQMYEDGIAQLQRYLDLVGPDTGSRRVQEIEALVEQLQRMEGGGSSAGLLETTARRNG
jgi:tetratricopeptide (TPR) repeat protein